jgi:hypothetical protein
MFALYGIPKSVKIFLSNYRSLFSRDEGFGHVSRYITGLLISPNKTVQGIYDHLVFGEDEKRSSRRSMHESLFEDRRGSDSLISHHRKIVSRDYRQPGRKVLILDWTLCHHLRGPCIFGVKKRLDYVNNCYNLHQIVLTAVIANKERFDGLEALVQRPTYEKEEKAYLEFTSKPDYDSKEEALKRISELLHHHLHNKRYKNRTELFFEMVSIIEKENYFSDCDYTFDNGVLCFPLTQLIEKAGKFWLSELEKSRNIFWKNNWIRIDKIAEELVCNHPEAFRKTRVKLRNGEIKTYWAFRKTVRLKKYGKKRILIIHEKEDLSDSPRFLLTNALHWESKRAIETWSYRWTCEIFHEFGKQITGLESAQLRNQEAVKKQLRLSCVAQSALSRVHVSKSTSEKFEFAKGKITCGQQVKQIAREAFLNLLYFIKELFEQGKSCQDIVDRIMPT